MFDFNFEEFENLMPTKKEEKKPAPAKKAEEKKPAKPAAKSKAKKPSIPAELETNKFPAQFKLVTAYGSVDIKSGDGEELTAAGIRALLKDADTLNEFASPNVYFFKVEDAKEPTVIAALNTADNLTELPKGTDVRCGGFVMHAEGNAAKAKEGFEPFMREGDIYKCYENDGKTVAIMAFKISANAVPKTVSEVMFYEDNKTEEPVKTEEFIKSVIGGTVPKNVTASIITVGDTGEDEEEEDAGEKFNILQFHYSGPGATGASASAAASKPAKSDTERKEEEDAEYMSQKVKLPVTITFPTGTTLEVTSDMFEGREEAELLEIHKWIGKEFTIFSNLPKTRDKFIYYGEKLSSIVIKDHIAREKGAGFNPF